MISKSSLKFALIEKLSFDKCCNFFETIFIYIMYKFFITEHRHLWVERVEIQAQKIWMGMQNQLTVRLVFSNFLNCKCFYNFYCSFLNPVVINITFIHNFVKSCFSTFQNKYCIGLAYRVSDRLVRTN